MSEKLIGDKTSAKQFVEKAIEFTKTNQKEGIVLFGELNLWASEIARVVNPNTDIYLRDILEPQISDQAKRKKISEKDFINGLFALNPEGKLTADIIMARLQL